MKRYDNHNDGELNPVMEKKMMMPMSPSDKMHLVRMAKKTAGTSPHPSKDRIMRQMGKRKKSKPMGY